MSISIWIYHYLCNQCLSPLMLRFRTPLNDEVYSIQHYVIKFGSDLRQVVEFSPSTPVASTNKTVCHDIADILLKVALNTINLDLMQKGKDIFFAYLGKVTKYIIKSSK